MVRSALPSISLGIYSALLTAGARCLCFPILVRDVCVEEESLDWQHEAGPRLCIVSSAGQSQPFLLCMCKGGKAVAGIGNLRLVGQIQAILSGL